MASVTCFIKDFLIGGIHCYRWLLSPILGASCRFYPSCSSYAQEALEKHGVLYGCFLVIKRLLKCHPMHSGGIDQVP